MRLTRSTKDRKKGCAHDLGALDKQGALKKQTLRYIHVAFDLNLVIGAYGGGSLLLHMCSNIISTDFNLHIDSKLAQSTIYETPFLKFLNLGSTHLA